MLLSSACQTCRPKRVAPSSGAMYHLPLIQSSRGKFKGKARGSFHDTTPRIDESYQSRIVIGATTKIHRKRNARLSSVLNIHEDALGVSRAGTSI